MELAYLAPVGLLCKTLLQLDEMMTLGTGCSIVHRAVVDLRIVQPSRFGQFTCILF